jgi:phenylalanyl-tRNA synthetase beta chain
MQFPESWLREFCNPDLSSAQLAELLTMAGMEVEDRRPVAPPFSGVVVAQILEATPHPQADRLRVCRVVVAPGAEPLQIVCGAPNARAGIKVALATVGAELPPGSDGKPFRIGVGKLRGVESFGMLCSARELGLSEDHGGLLELDDAAALGQDLRQALHLDDQVFTLKLTPNLGHALGLLGIAREVSALTGAPLKAPAIAPAATAHSDVLPVKVLAPDLCGRFSGRIVRGVNPQAVTPAWMARRLQHCGQRPVNVLVDISNYVMFEFGRPSHIFDLDKIQGGLDVRWGRTGEQLELLNGSTVAVDESVGVIADKQGLESLAGIMGGQATAVSDSTRNIYIEAAFWWPEAVAGRSRRLGFSTDAGHRFERGVDPASTVEHVEHITALVQQICGGQAGPIDDQQPRLPVRPPVALRVARASKLIGMPVLQAQCADVFTRLGLPFTEAPGLLTVTPPSWRFDLALEEDLVEEVVRVLGVNTLPATPPVAPVLPKPRPEARRSAFALRRALAGLGYQEVITFSFVEARWEHELAGNANPIRVLNPIAAPLSVMRSSLIGSLVATLRHNLARRAERVRLFELGRVFIRDESVPDGERSVAGLRQPQRVAGLAWGPADTVQWGQAERAVDFFDVKGDLQALLEPWARAGALCFVPGTHPALHPGRCARVEIHGRTVGHIGELHPQWRQAYELPASAVLFELDLDALLERPVPAFAPLPRQQAVQRDIALVVALDTSHDSLMAHLVADGRQGVREAWLFDVYRPKPLAAGSDGFAPGERSLAFRLTLQDSDEPWTEEGIQAAVAAAVARASQATGARLRS